MSEPKDKPKHQPSPKHTLEEVLRSLQDLVRNELTEERPAPAKDKTAKKSAAERSAETPRVETPKEKPQKTAASTPVKQPAVRAEIQAELPLMPPLPPAAPVDATWDDIPVLQDVVIAPPLPPGIARERMAAVARRVLIALNQELRQAGQPPLDPVIIPRLTELLREALEAEIGPAAKS